jgi:hypothetical protein
MGAEPPAAVAATVNSVDLEARAFADDRLLLRNVAAGDERALAALYDRHAGWLLVRMSRRCASPEMGAAPLE